MAEDGDEVKIEINARQNPSRLKFRPDESSNDVPEIPNQEIRQSGILTVASLK